jgi:glycosyltransferase involved in cell wall biosynthesis
VTDGKVLRIFHGGGVPAYQRRDESLARLGWKVTLIAPKRFRELPIITVAEPRSDEITVVPVGLYGYRRNPWFFYNPVSLARRLRRMSPTLLDIHEEPYSLAMLSVLVARWLSCKSPTVVFRTSQNVYKDYPFPFSLIQSHAFRAAAAYGPSQQAIDVLQKKGYAGLTAVIGNGIDISPEGGFRPRDFTHPLRVLLAGRLTERKGVSELLTAAIRLRRLVEVVFVGEGPMEAEIRSAMEAAPETIRLISTVEPEVLRQIMLKNDVVCVPSRVLPGWSEQFSRVLAEGMGSFLVPCVSTSGALSEVAGPTASIFRAGDAADLERSLRELATDKHIDDRRKGAYDFSARSYSWDATGLDLDRLYSEAAS